MIESHKSLPSIPDTDATGHPTVGYGHMCTKSKCAEVKYKIPLSKTDGKKLLADDMAVSSPSHLLSSPSLHVLTESVNENRNSKSASPTCSTARPSST